MGRSDDPWDRPTQPDRDVHYRIGLLMARVQELDDRITALENLHDDAVRMRTTEKRSLRPTVERIGVSAFVAGVVAGIVQGLAQFFR